MISDFDLARKLFPRPAEVVRAAGADVPRTSQVHGRATSDSDGGAVTVVLDTEAGGEYAEMEVPTLGGITEGADVLVTMLDGTPVDCSQVGSIDGANAAAEAAQQVAAATSQHFWYDDNGAHVTEATQDEWAESQSGPNSLWNSLGMLFRDGLTNLLAILTDGLVVYDGEGNTNTNTVAAIGKIVRLGYEAAAHIAIGSGSIGMFNGENEIFSLVGTETVREDTSTTTTSDISTMSVGNGDYGKASLSFERYHFHSASQDSYRNDIELGVDTDNDGINNTYFRLTDVTDTDSSGGTPQGSAKLKANYLALENDSTDGFYTMQHVMDVLNGGGGAEDGTFTKGSYCNNFNRASVWRQGHMGGFSIVLQTTSNATNKAWMNVGTISIHPKAEIRCLCGNETGSFSVINITTTGQVTMLQSASGSMWSQINVVFPV